MHFDTHIYIQDNYCSKQFHKVALHIIVFLGHKRNWSMVGVSGLSGNHEQSCESDMGCRLSFVLFAWRGCGLSWVLLPKWHCNFGHC